MISNRIPPPHGDLIVNLQVDSERAVLLKEIALSLPDMALNERQLCDLELLATGALSPRTVFIANRLRVGSRPDEASRRYVLARSDLP